MKKSLLKISLCAALALTVSSAFASVTSLNKASANKLFGSVNPLHPVRMTTTLTFPKTLSDITLAQTNGIHASLNGTTLTLDYYVGQPVTLFITGVQHGGGAKDGGLRQCHYTITTTEAQQNYTTNIQGYVGTAEARITTRTMCGPKHQNGNDPKLEVRYLD